MKIIIILLAVHKLLLFNLLSADNKIVKYTNNIEVVPGLRMIVTTDYEWKNDDISEYEIKHSISPTHNILIIFTNTTKSDIILTNAMENWFFILKKTDGTVIPLNEKGEKICKKEPSSRTYKWVIRPAWINVFELPPLSTMYDLEKDEEYIFEFRLWYRIMEKPWYKIKYESKYYLSNPAILKVDKMK